MKFKFDRKLAVKAGCLALLLLAAPFALEFILIADFVGIEFAATFMLLYFKTAIEEAIRRWWVFKKRIYDQCMCLLETAMFQPRGYGVSATAFCVVLFVSCSTALACSVWLPVMLMSGGGLGA